VERIIAFGPRSGTALNITLLSHDGTAHLGVNHDPVAIPDGEALVAALADGIDEVLALGAPRRTTGRGAAGSMPSGTRRRGAATGEKRRPRR
jgi:hypothetical protein